MSHARPLFTLGLSDLPQDMMHKECYQYIDEPADTLHLALVSKSFHALFKTNLNEKLIEYCLSDDKRRCKRLTLAHLQKIANTCMSSDALRPNFFAALKKIEDEIIAIHSDSKRFSEISHLKIDLPTIKSFTFGHFGLPALFYSNSLIIADEKSNRFNESNLNTIAVFLALSKLKLTNEDRFDHGLTLLNKLADINFFHIPRINSPKGVHIEFDSHNFDLLINVTNETYNTLTTININRLAGARYHESWGAVEGKISLLLADEPGFSVQATRRPG